MRSFLVICLLIPSLGFAHMANPDLELDNHGVSYGVIMSASQLQQVSIPSVLVSTYTGNIDHLYLVLDVCTSLDSWCPQRLLDLSHDIVVNDTGCVRSYKYLGQRVTKKWNDYYQDYVFTYGLVHQYTGYPGWFSHSVTINSEGIKNYSLYIQYYSYSQDYGYEPYNINKGLYTTSQSSLPNPRIDKFVGLNEYQYFKPWRSDFTFDEYRDAVGNDKYYIRADVPGYPGCIWDMYIETFFIVPLCVTKDSWQLKLCRRQDNGSLWCTKQLSNDTTTWKFYGRPSFGEVSSVFIKDLYRGQLAKSDFIQDETIYISSDPNRTMGNYSSSSTHEYYQGFSYWYAVATYNGNAYVIRMYGSDPLCNNAYSGGLGHVGSGKGSQSKGRGVKSFGGGGIEERRR